MFVTHESSSLYSFQRSRTTPAPDLTECMRNAPEEPDFIDRVERRSVELSDEVHSLKAEQCSTWHPAYRIRW
jgi:hypothetical protein